VSEKRTSDQPDAQQGSVFGNLPDSRPGARSPRRRTGATKAAGGGAKARPRAGTAAKGRAAPKAKAKTMPSSRQAPKAKPKPAAEKPRSEPAPERAETEREGAGLEDLAWAGVATVAEAATIGIRLASRAMEALRKPSDGR
jgi:hypothetical protein